MSGDPSPWQWMTYLVGVRVAPPAHRPALRRFLDDADDSRRGLVLALPNALVLVVVALGFLAFGDGISFVILGACAALALALGWFAPPITERRAAFLRRRHQLASPATDV
ncbi:MAG: hypothetical protein AB7L84_00740 [Acidimicrobiia bacterium]